MAYLFNLIFFRPLFNALVWLSAVIPNHNLALAIIALTLGVKLVLLPLQRQMIRAQLKMKELEPAIKKLKEKYPDKAEQAKQMMELYRREGVNPFSGFLTLLIQLPILIALYLVFQGSFDFHQPALLYAFIIPPAVVGTTLFGVSLAAKSYVLAFLTAITQFVQAWIMMPTTTKPAAGAPSTFQNDLARSMSLQMRYVLPVVVGVIALGLPAALPLYWVVSNLFTIGAELYFRRPAAAKNRLSNQASIK